MKIKNMNAKNKDGWTVLIHAAVNGYVDIVKHSLVKGADVNAKDNFGRTALIYTAIENRADVVKELLANGADVNAKDDFGETALIHAVINHRVYIVNELLAKGADVNAKDNRGYTAMIHAAIDGSTSIYYGYRASIIEELLANGADMNAKDNFGRTALIHAAMKAHVNFVKVLLESGADVNVKDNRGYTAQKWLPDSFHSYPSLINPDLDKKLFQAVKDLNVGEVKSLIDAGADVNAKNSSYETKGIPVLNFAIDRTYIEEEDYVLIIKMLIDACANVNVSKPWTPLKLAANNCLPKTVKLLIDNGADTSHIDENMTVFDYILKKHNDRYRDVLYVLAINTPQGKKWLESPEGKEWHQICYEIDSTSPISTTKVEIIKVLRKAMMEDGSEAQQQIHDWVEAGGNLAWRAPGGWTLLHIAAQSGIEKMVRFLILDVQVF